MFPLSARLSMIRAAARGCRLLGASARQVAQFVAGCLNEDGGFRGRSPQSDLYFTSFALDCLLALEADFPRMRVADYLRSFRAAGQMDLVHLACLARCWANLSFAIEPAARSAILAGLERHRSADGGCNQLPGCAEGTAYGCFLALGAYQDLQVDVPGAQGLVRCVRSLGSGDGGCGNSPRMRVGATAATAAAAVVLSELGQAPMPQAASWLLARQSRSGGFLAAPAAPVPDLLSTATALHALACLKVDLQAVRKPHLAFVEGLWDKRGGFHAHWAEREIDCEYAFYGLLALGQLSA